MNTIHHDMINSGDVLNNLMVQTHNIVIGLDLNLCVKTFNLQAELLFKLKLKSVINKNYLDLCTLAKIQPAISYNLPTLLNHQKIIYNETLLKSHKETKTIAWRATQLMRENHHIGYLIIGEDVTRLKYLEKQVLDKERAEAANQAKSEFLAIMSHELRTPLNAILGMTQILSNMQNLTHEQHEFVHDISIAGNHLLILINDMLDFAKLEAGKMDLKLTNIDFKSLLDEATDMMAYPAKLKGLTLVTSFDTSLPSHLMADGRALRQILNNLISNAIKFTDKGQINFSINCLAKNDKKVKLELIVEDTGIGIPHEKLQLIFDRFQQVDSSYSRRYGGTGLGLAITKQLTELMGGKISVESKIGLGTKFRCVFNFQLKENVLSDLHHLTEQLNVHILIVDDSRRGKIMLKQIDDGHNRVVTGHNAMQVFLEAHQTGSPFDIVIIDQQLKECDAIELGSTLKKASAATESIIILLIEQHSIASVTHYKKLGFFECLTKPVHPMELIATLNAAKKYKNDRKIKPLKENPANKNNLLKEHPSNQNNLRVLLVEDNLINQKVSKMMLEEIGCEVDIADSGKSVFQLLDNHSYNIILMDIGLPDINGLEVTKIIREKHYHLKNIPIIALTAHAYDTDRQACLSAGMNDVIVKPVMRERLNEILQQWGKTK